MNPVTACFIRRVSNGYIVKAHDAERGVVVEEVYRTIDEAVAAIAALSWSGEEVYRTIDEAVAALAALSRSGEEVS